MICTEKDIQDLRDLRDAFDSMKVKQLTQGAYEDYSTGLRCSIGVLSKWRGADPSELCDDDDQMCISERLFDRIVMENDKDPEQSPEDRWQRMRNWLDKQLQEVA